MCFTVQLSRFFVLSLRQLVYFISSLFVCQVLFSSFFKSFFCVALSCETALILYHFLFFLSSTFSKFFQKVFRDQLRSLLRQLNYYITFSFLCQALFKKFFQLVSVFLPEWTPLTLPLLFLFPKVKVIFSSLSPAVPRARQ